MTEEVGEQLFGSSSGDAQSYAQIDQEWFRLCLHETAHSFIAHHFGIADIARICINGGLRGGGRTQIDAPKNPAAMIAVILAGGIVEQLVFGRAEGCNGDRAQLAEYVRRLGWSEDDERIAIIRRMTRRVIKAGLDEIVAAAKQLTEPGGYTVRWRPGAIQ